MTCEIDNTKGYCENDFQDSETTDITRDTAQESKSEGRKEERDVEVFKRQYSFDTDKSIDLEIIKEFSKINKRYIRKKKHPYKNEATYCYNDFSVHQKSEYRKIVEEYICHKYGDILHEDIKIPSELNIVFPNFDVNGYKIPSMFYTEQSFITRAHLIALDSLNKINEKKINELLEVIKTQQNEINRLKELNESLIDSTMELMKNN